MCGFLAITGLPQVAPSLALGVQAIQHRGQDAAGLGTWSGGRFHLFKDLGMVGAALPPQVVRDMPGSSGIAHVRYPTHGGGSREDAQPFLTRRPGMLMAHNGNVTNTPVLELQLADAGLHMLSQCDAEHILLVLADELMKVHPGTGHSADDLALALRGVMQRVRGSYSVVAVLEVDRRETLLAFRDPHGIRPGVYGTRDDGSWAVASESVALDVLGYQLRGHLPPGGMVLFRRGDAPVLRQVMTAAPRHCIFEHIYFARADAVMEGGRVNATRWALGERLAEELKAKGVDCDVVVAVPDTSRPAALAISEALGVPNREGFIKNRYSGRTFIMPDQASRQSALRLKLNPIAEVFRGKRVLLVDDSIVRGNTSRRLVQMVRGLGPAEVHFAIFSPPVRNPCFYGIDMPSREELIAARFDSAEAVEAALCEELGADSVTYLSQRGLDAVSGPDVCNACFTGDYVVEVDANERAQIIEDRRPELRAR